MSDEIEYEYISVGEPEPYERERIVVTLTAEKLDKLKRDFTPL